MKWKRFWPFSSNGHVKRKRATADEKRLKEDVKSLESQIDALKKQLGEKDSEIRERDVQIQIREDRITVLEDQVLFLGRANAYNHRHLEELTSSIGQRSALVSESPSDEHFGSS